MIQIPAQTFSKPPVIFPKRGLILSSTLWYDKSGPHFIISEKEYTA